ncbi:M20 family metallopeptidase [Staphylococcus durrellii]|uniref:M20 family metallopeptidase n=1 Tax=Staphylococcus durrellii TaxID=2781773 RepID=UPI0018A0F1B5|nr:M20/M25/M40 family metallo-hydrolase [Staphylococcus durrellii]MBF7016089.1 M20/M25/M40 family metallo-hydrolase [Staphylococcus durrellii]
MSKAVELLQQLIKYDSSDKSVANETIAFCKRWLESEGVTAEIISNNGFDMLICEVGQGDKTLVLNGHVDVVSGKETQFDPIIKEGKLYGRGSADMKAGVAAIMVAVAELNKLELTQTKVQLQLVTDEEIGGKNCANYLTNEGYLGDFVICPEPTQIDIGFQAKGILQIDIELSGASAHGSRPWEGVNAIDKAFEVYDQLLHLPFASESTEFYDGPSINLAKIHGGEVYNKVPDACTLSFDIRYLPTQNQSQILKEIEGITDGKIHINLEGPPVMNDKNQPYIKQLVGEIKQHTNKDEVKLFGQHGFADTRYFSRFNVPAVEFGPSGNHWHGDGEYVEVDSIENYKNIIVTFAQNM